MQLTDKQIEKFKKIHEQYGGLGNYTDKEIRDMANGVANYFLTLWEIERKNKKAEDK